MFKVYYTITKPHSESFLGTWKELTGECLKGGSTTETIGNEFTELTAALRFSEDLRTRRRNGEIIRYITMCSENPESVGEQGVADVKPGYDWKKRRI